MLRFEGMLDGVRFTDAVRFIEEARTSDELVPKEAIKTIMNMLSEEQLFDNKFTKKEISMVDGYEVINDIKPTYYVKRTIECEEEDFCILDLL